MKRDSQSQCGACGSERGGGGGGAPAVFLHNLPHEGGSRRLCTACVLKNHPGSFCPVCFDFFDDHPPPPHGRLMCLHCPSVAHLSCATAPRSSYSNVAPQSGYRCPACSNPNHFSCSHVLRGSGKKSKLNGGGSPAISESSYKDFSKQLVVAAKISLASLNRAAAAARIEADRRVKEAVLAKKRAKEALEKLDLLAAKERLESESIAVTAPQPKSGVPPRSRIQNQTRADGSHSRSRTTPHFSEGGRKKANNELHFGHSRHRKGNGGRKD